MAAATKYVRQRTRARQIITAKGTICTWYKTAIAAPESLPEFQDNTDPVGYPTPIVFYPMKRISLETILQVALTGSYTKQLFAAIPGDVPFTPAIDDAVQVGTELLRVSAINVTAPDLVPIVYEISFQ